MKSKILIILALFAILTSSCHKCRKKSPFKITKVDKQMIPYTIEQTVRFVDSEGHFLVFIVNSVNITTDEYEKCVPFETLNVSLKSERDNLTIYLSINSNDGNYIEIWLRPLIYYLYYDKKGNFYTREKKFHYEQYFHENLEINNKFFYDVVECIVNEPNYYVENKDRLPLRVLYNKTYGILQLEDKDKVILTIDN